MPSIVLHWSHLTVGDVVACSGSWWTVAELESFGVHGRVTLVDAELHTVGFGIDPTSTSDTFRVHEHSVTELRKMPDLRPALSFIQNRGLPRFVAVRERLREKSGTVHVSAFTEGSEILRDVEAELVAEGLA